jgi:predicted transcriptional regulator
MDPATTALTNLTISTRKIDSLLAQQKITVKDIEDLSNPEREHLGETATKILSQLKGAERDDFLDKIEQIVPADTKNGVWEHNHGIITTAISNFMRRYSVMPTKNAIADETGLSRQTVAKHFAAYRQHPEFIAEMEQFKFMSHDILANVFKHASNGDMRAARLYFEMVGTLNKQPAGTVVNAQNNYIQINNTILNQETLKQLTAEQLNLIENIVTNKKYKIVS